MILAIPAFEWYHMSKSWNLMSTLRFWGHSIEIHSKFMPTHSNSSQFHRKSLNFMLTQPCFWAFPSQIAQIFVNSMSKITFSHRVSKWSWRFQLSIDTICENHENFDRSPYVRLKIIELAWKMIKSSMNQLKNHINLHEKCPSPSYIRSKSHQLAWKMSKSSMNQLKNHINLHEKCPSQACINSKSSQPAWKIAKLTMCQLFSMMIHPNLRSEFMIADLIKIHVQVHDELTFDRWINSFDVVFMMNRSSTSLISTQQRSTSWDPLDLSSERWVDDELDDDHRCELMRSKSNFSLMPTSIFKLEWSSSKYAIYGSSSSSSTQSCIEWWTFDGNQLRWCWWLMKLRIHPWTLRFSSSSHWDSKENHQFGDEIGQHRSSLSVSHVSRINLLVYIDDESSFSMHLMST